MKDKSYIIFIVMALVMTIFLACDPEEYKTERPATTQTENPFIPKQGKLSRIKVSGVSTFMTLYELEYEGGRYIIAKDGEGLAITPIIEKPKEPTIEEVAEPVEPDNTYHWDY